MVDHKKTIMFVQTQDVKERLAEKIKTPKSKINLVTNGVGEHFKNTKIIAKNNNALKKLLMISAFRPSKNFEIINKIIPYLKDDDGFNYEFHITISDQDYNKLFKGKEKWVKNHGETFAKDCPKLYNSCDAIIV